MIFVTLFDGFFGTPPLSGPIKFGRNLKNCPAKWYNGICSVNCIAKVAATAASATKSLRDRQGETERRDRQRKR